MLSAPRARRGFTLAELLVAVVLTGIVSTSIYRLITSGGRFFRQHSSRIEVGENLRAAASFLASEVRELSSDGGDLVEINASSMTYRAMRSTAFVCADPDEAGSELLISREPMLGLRALEAGRDSVLVLAAGDPMAGADPWIAAAVTRVELAAACPSGSQSLRVSLSGLDSNRLAGVRLGAPVRAFQPTRIRSYRDASGATWIGLSEWRDSTGWSVTQPIVGPLAPRGFSIAYLDEGGALTADPSLVALVRFDIAMIGSLRSLPAASAAPADSLTTVVSLRNRRRPANAGS